MKTLTIVTAVVIPLVLSPSLSWSADNTSAQPASENAAQNVVAPTPNDSVNPTMNTQATQTPPQNWTKLQGTVQAVDPAAKLVSIKDNAGSVIQVPVDKNVTIKKDGKKINLTQVQTGDIVVLAKRNPTPQEGTKTY